MRNELQKQPLEVFCKKGALNNFAKSTGKHLCQSLFFNKHCTKTIFSFSRRPEKMVFPKKLRWNLIFLALSGKTIFFFSENMILPLDGRWKMIFLKKIHVLKKKIQIFWKDGLFKKYRAGHDISCTIWKGGIFYPKTWYFLPGRKSREGWPFSRNTRKHDIFYLICSTPPCGTKIKDDPIPQKYT